MLHAACDVGAGGVHQSSTCRRTAWQALPGARIQQLVMVPETSTLWPSAHSQQHATASNHAVADAVYCLACTH
jgi:hypothetical protein